MPSFAEIDTQTNEVLRVISADSKIWCEYNLGGKWVQTHKKTEGKNYAGVGFTYHPELENFSGPQPHPSWTLDDQCLWQPPVAKPDDGGYYRWDEESQSWISSGGI